jgi:Xaa-Pro aminopeptidase
MLRDESTRAVVSRRDVLAATLGAAALGGTQAAGAAAPRTAGRSFAPASHAPFVNFERAYALMEANGVDAIVCRVPTNTYYLTSFRPFWWLESYRGLPIALMTRRPQDPISMVASAQSYYYMYADARPEYEYRPYLYTAPDPGAAPMPGSDPAAQRARPFRDVGLVPPIPREAGRAQALEAAATRVPPSVDEAAALRRALRDLGLERGCIAVDDDAVLAQVATLAPAARVLRGDNLVRRIRQVKPPHVLALSRHAAQANAEAARAAARTTARPGATLRELHAAFYREVSVRGGTPVGMVIDMVSSPLYDADLRRGDTFFIDCVSEFQLCHGDYGRTISLGEPRAGMKRATQAAQLGWTSIRERLRPGLKFSEIRAIGREALRRDGYDFDVGFTPHNVGLTHTEEPDRPDLPFHVADTVLEAGMVLSVDCPVVNTGMGGSAHLEDLVVITPDGHEPINELAEPVIVV